MTRFKGDDKSVVLVNCKQQLSGIKITFFTGITGQHSNYLAELLFANGYEVQVLKRRLSSFNASLINHKYKDPHEADPRLVLHFGYFTDSTNVIWIIQQVQPDEIYNLNAQSPMAVSLKAQEYTANSDELLT